MNIRDLIPYLPKALNEIALEAPTNPESYSDRQGYDKDFLGQPVALPLLKDLSELTEPSHQRKGHPFELCYEKFSVVMHKARRLCCITAVNIDGSQPFYSPKRPGWKLDPRLPADLQVGGSDFYVPTSFDRGHMVRRLDPVWGEESDALVANKDTHHYTNSCPQVHSFNDGIWGDLEDWILSQGRTRDSKASVFTGPIFQDTDRTYGGVRVPEKYYKVVVVVDDATDTLSVTAFTMDQSQVMPKTESVQLEALFDPGDFVNEQITVADLQEQTGLDLEPLKKYDALAALPVPESLTQGRPLRVPLAGPQSAVLWRQPRQD